MTTVGLWGTFDVDNYGDQLFPRVAGHELGKRLPGLDIRVFSPLGWHHPTRLDGEVRVEPLGEWQPGRLRELGTDLDAVIVGGGEIIHLNDRMLAPVYGVDPDELTRINASGFFVEGLGHNLELATPLLWNAVGVAIDPTPAEASRLATALNRRHYIAVRDSVSLSRLRDAGVTAEITLVPDTAVIVDRVIGRERRAAALDRLRRRGDVPATAPFIAVQGCDLLVPYAPVVAAALRDWLADRPLVRVVLIETGPCRGDGDFADAITPLLGERPHRVPLGPTGLDDIAAVIAASEGFVGSSLHGSITALACARPFVIVNFARESKLRAFAELIGQPSRTAADPTALRAALATDFTRAVPCNVVTSLQARVDEHFDRMAAIIRTRSYVSSQPVLTPREP